jgi:hypothetical protein
MSRKTIFGLAIALFASVATSAQAQVIYTVPATTTYVTQSVVSDSYVVPTTTIVPTTTTYSVAPTTYTTVAPTTVRYATPTTYTVMPTTTTTIIPTTTTTVIPTSVYVPTTNVQTIYSRGLFGRYRPTAAIVY